MIYDTPHILRDTDDTAAAVISFSQRLDRCSSSLPVVRYRRRFEVLLWYQLEADA